MTENITQNAVPFNEFPEGNNFRFAASFHWPEDVSPVCTKIGRYYYHRASGGDTCLLHTKNPLVVPMA